VRVAGAEVTVPLEPERARELWTDVRRWPTFVEGFSSAVELSGDWPREGSKLVWQSTKAGRGRVTERVADAAPERFSTQVYEDALTGTQTVSFVSASEGTGVELRLEYELNRYGPLRAVADLLFIRRALRDALRRTLRNFAVEAEEEAGLR
jgi:hypothetical protein